MDGRAQAAYDPVTFYKWSDLMSGGPRSVEIKTKNLKFKAEDYRRISQWLDERFKADDVWLILMPAEQFAEPMVMSFNFHPHWKVVFKNNKQEMFVDITTPQGKKLYEGIFNNVPEIYDPNKYTTVFPDDFSKYYVLSHHYLTYNKNRTIKDVQEGFKFAKLAFEDNPSGFTLQNLLMAKNYKFIAPQVIDYITKYLEKFLQEKDSLKKESGYHDRLIAVLMISEQLRAIAIKNRDQSGIEKYSELRQDLSSQRVKLIANRNW